MFKKPSTWVIVGLVFIILIFIMRDCSRPSEEKEADRKKQYETEVAILKAEKSEIQSRQDSAVKRYKDKLEVDSINLRAQESKIQALDRKAVQQRTPRVETLIIDNPELLSFVTTQQEIITELKVEVDTLKAQAQFQRKLNEDLIIAEFQEDRAEQQMFIEQARRVDELGKQVKKKERKSRLAKILVPVAAVAGLLFGSQL